MQDPFAGEQSKSKAAAVADAINRLLQNLAIKCAKSEGIRDYYYVAVIGYGGKGVHPAFTGKLSGRELVPISEIADNPARIEQRTKKISDGAGGLIDSTVKFPVWFDAVADGGTPMCQALSKATSIVVDWLSKHPNCFPPIIINISDGEPTDGEPLQTAYDLMNLTSSDGNVLLFNLHISSTQHQPIEYPDSDRDLPDAHSRMLFNMSSPLPEYIRDMVHKEGVAVSSNTRGFVFNADIVSVVRFLDIGTRPSNLR